MYPVRIRMVVVLPAPFGPRKPRISPLCTLNETLSTAVRGPYRLVRFSTSIMALSLVNQSDDKSSGSDEGRLRQPSGNFNDPNELAGGTGAGMIPATPGCQ